MAGLRYLCADGARDGLKPAGPAALARAPFKLAALTVAVVLSLGIGTALPLPAHAQLSGEDLFGSSQNQSNAQMLLEADELIYDQVNSSVVASGNVQIAYDGYTLVAQRVTYNRASGRVIANGGVEIVEPNGNRIFAEEIDITDDFRNGFVDALRVETPDNTHFAAESAERRDGSIAVFNNGVYTACEPCRDNPSKPPLWQIRADRVIINSEAKTVSYEKASFEFFGHPIAYLPYFSHADPSIKRKSGFIPLRPRISEELGFSAGAAYFWALAPHYDLTLSGRYYSRQGFLGEAEWRHRTYNGEYNFRIAGIDQQRQVAFDSGEIDRSVEERGAIMSTGRFDLNSRWAFGWNVLAQSDGNFARTYDLEGYSDREITNQVYLTGLNDKNYFDLRAQKFLIQDDSKDQMKGALFTSMDDKLQEQQARVLPSFDYNLVSDDPVAGGQVSLDVNVTSVDRDKIDIVNYAAGPGITTSKERFHGIEGRYTRASTEAEWKASSIVNGALVTTALSARGDGMWLDTNKLNTEYNPLTSNDQIWRGMPAATLEIRYPLVANDGMVSHLFEPIAQVIVRPDETHIGAFPNEDAQSMVFDTSNLFERDKFSGFDRVEGGTRANVGFRYAMAFTGGASINFMAGQSYHLAGQNSFAKRDLVNAGLESGLETDKSDYVASVDLNTGAGITVGLDGRFDEKSLNMRRGEANLRYVDPVFAGSASYIFIASQPNYGLDEDRHEIRGSGSVKVSEYVRLFGSAAFDIQNSSLFSHSYGVAYDDSCFSLSATYSESDNRYDGETVERSVMFRLGLRTIGETEYKRVLEDNTTN
ncbi:MAG: LPS-assembly protein LptD [Nitratireductor sp.]|nr:LPS-assembly protein LptD [Nitratireductor sp.]